MSDTPTFVRAVELVRQLVPLDRHDPRRTPLAAELDTLAEKMTRLEYDRLHLFWIKLKEGA